MSLVEFKVTMRVDPKWYKLKDNAHGSLICKVITANMACYSTPGSLKPEFECGTGGFALVNSFKKIPKKGENAVTSDVYNYNIFRTKTASPMSVITSFPKPTSGTLPFTSGNLSTSISMGDDGFYNLQYVYTDKIAYFSRQYTCPQN